MYVYERKCVNNRNHQTLEGDTRKSEACPNQVLQGHKKEQAYQSNLLSSFAAMNLDFNTWGLAGREGFAVLPPGTLSHYTSLKQIIQSFTTMIFRFLEYDLFFLFLKT